MKIHDFGPDRLDALKQVTSEISVCGNTGTAVSVSMGNRVTTVTVAHHNCDGKVPVGYIPCEGIDIALRVDECPPMAAALNFDRNAPLRDGDQVVSLGFYSGNKALRGPRSWSGHISSLLSNIAENATCSQHFSGCGVGHYSHSYVINADQLDGMSGAVVMNGYGVVGIVVATTSPKSQVSFTSQSKPMNSSSCIAPSSEFVETSSNDSLKVSGDLSIPRHRQALVIGADLVEQCIRRNIHLLKTKEQCQSVSEYVDSPLLFSEVDDGNF